MRPFTKIGHDWTKPFPLIFEAALKNRQNHFVIDGESGGADHDRHPRPVPACLPARAGRHGVQARRPRVSRGTLRPLDQEQEPQAPAFGRVKDSFT
ncbi:hypothetical protein [Bradyrhizobium ottawaense]|uniref:hypothetical protein n=1 Tax=Bradyrhizobium ottawaense TaxID=931866 RepID=UPI0030F3FABE